jgi:hypothetical protein
MLIETSISGFEEVRFPQDLACYGFRKIDVFPKDETAFQGANAAERGKTTGFAVAHDLLGHCHASFQYRGRDRRRGLPQN